MENSLQPKKDNYPLHIGLFVLTVFTTLMAGAALTTGHPLGMDYEGGFFAWLGSGSTFSFSFLLFLTVHEFGHYFTAVYHRVACSLPYYIPMPPIIGLIGSLGAVIRLKEHPSTTTKVFDIGIAGPLAGFVVSILLLTWGFTHLPPLQETVIAIHPEYVTEFGGIPTETELLAKSSGEMMGVGTCLLFEGMKWLLVSDPAEFPPAFELMHYPFLFVGFLTLFFTALNLLPIGQLDGGHVIFGLFGPRRSGIISRVAVLALLLIGGMGLVRFTGFDPAAGGDYNAWLFDVLLWVMVYAVAWHLTLHQLFPRLGQVQILTIVLAVIGLSALATTFLPQLQPNYIWLIYTFMAVRLIGVDHPPVLFVEPLSRRRKILGWIAIVIFILCFTTDPIYIR
jgi:membrane-associated protease RseP (regulator of RpoE activity)